MSKAVSISEGGKGRIFPQTDKLKINNVGGGNSLWLPEDEVVTGTLYADENGIYLAENDGFSCYDTVVVRVEDETDPDDPDWELDPDELDEDIWDEESLEEFQEDPEAFEEKFNDKEKWKAEKAKKEKSQKIKKVKSLKPSKITGIDPVDGNPYQVGVDSEGNLTKEMLPSSIHIVVPPWKREYEEGEEINFYGMHVYLLDKDGHPFKSEKYPTGEIPFEELLLPVTTAQKSDAQWGDIDPSKLEGEYNLPLPIYSGGIHGRYTQGNLELIVIIDGYVMVWGHNWFCVSLTDSYTEIIGDYVRTISLGAAMRDVVPGKLIYGTGGGNNYCEWNDFISYEGSFQHSILRDMARICYGDGTLSNGNDIPVQWNRSDGITLEDKFSITVPPNVML